MRTVTSRRGLILMSLLLLGVATVLADRPAVRDRDWNNIKHVTRKRNMAVVRYDGTCIIGRIKAVTDGAVTMLTLEGATITTGRPDVMRVEDDNEIYDVVYSGRSSWYDVKGMSHNESEGLKITTKDGKTHEGRFAKATDREVTLLMKSGNVTFSKEEVARVEYIRIKPLSAKADYLAHEGLAWMAPEVWPWYLHIGKYLTVRIYEASLPEDDTPLPCRERQM